MRLINAAIEDATVRSEGRVLGMAGYVTAVLHKVFAKLGVNSRRELPVARRKLEGAVSPA
jgi:hypothetical protein